MAKRRALIVDDSKTAQVRLRKMLERFDLEVDTVLSAEEALGYLSYRQPSVIFLDHHMEGMDGLEALKIIKSNPATALIPVIMYTSEKGDVYVGQARALGAIDILGKEVIKHASLEKVLGSLGISGSEPEKQDRQLSAKKSKAPLRQVPANYDSGEMEDTGASESEKSSDLGQVQQQISRLFEIHIAKVRQEIEDSTKFLTRRIAKDAQDRGKVQRNTAPAHQVGETEQVVPVEPIMVSESDKSGISGVFLGVILISIAFLGYHLYINNRHQVLLSEQYSDLIERTRNQEDLIGRLFSKVTESTDARISAKAYADRQVLLDALGWAVNVDTQVAFGEQALGDQRIYMLGELLALLKAANFQGSVYLDVHLGDFCVIEDLSGGWILPEPESNIEDCLFISERVKERPINQQVSVGFMNYLQSAPILSEGDIQVELTAQGYSDPRFSYPAVTSATSAGEWNVRAQKNNRISVSFSSN